MKITLKTTPCLLTCFLTPLSATLAQAQATEPSSVETTVTAEGQFQFSHTKAPEMPDAVKAAEVQASTVALGAAGGAKLTVQRIAPPILPPSVVPARAVSQSKMTPEQWAARRASAPLEYRPFSPAIALHPDGFCLVRWYVASAAGEWSEYEAWVATDLSTIQGCGDIDVGRRRYLLTPMVYSVSSKLAQRRTAPQAEAFQNGAKHVLVKGDPTNEVALAPLLALLAIYEQDGPQIIAADIKQKELQQARMAWEKENPPPIRDTEVRFWPLQSTQYSTTPVAAK